MAVHVRLEGDQAAAQLYLPLAQQLMHRVRQLAALSGASVTSKHLNPNEFTLIYAMKMAQFEVIQIHCTPATEGEESLTTQTLPDLLSGWTRGATISEDPGPPAKKYLTAFKPSDSMKKPGASSAPAGWGRSQQLAVPPSALALEFPPTQTDATDSQYRRVFASNYSGAMAKCVQTLLGYGRPKRSTLLKGKPLPAEGTQVVYDYRFYRTHGLTKVGDDWWLVEISAARGIVACELEMYPGSYARGKGSARADIKEMVNALHGLPTGRGMLQGATFDAAVPAGTAIQLMTPEALNAKFYKDWKPHSTALGWLFSPDGTQAHNTAWKQKSGRREGAHFMIQLDLSKGQDGKIKGSAKIDLCDLGNLPDYEVLDAYEPLTNQLTGDLGKELELGYFVRTPQKGKFSAPVHVYWGEDGVQVWRYRSDTDMKPYNVASGGSRKTVKIPVWPPDPQNPGAMEDFVVPVQSFSAATTGMDPPAAGIYRPDELFEHQAANVTEETYDGGYSGQAEAILGVGDIINEGSLGNPKLTGSATAGGTFLLAKAGELRSTVLPGRDSAMLRLVPQNLRDGFIEFWHERKGPGYMSWQRSLSYEVAQTLNMHYYYGQVYILPGSDIRLYPAEQERVIYAGVRDGYSVPVGEDSRLTQRKRLIYDAYNLGGLVPTFPPVVGSLRQLLEMDRNAVEWGGPNWPLPAGSLTTGQDGSLTSRTTLRVMAFGRQHEVEWLPWGGVWYPSAIAQLPPQCVASAIGTPAAVVSRGLGSRDVTASSFFFGALQGEDKDRPPKQFNFIGAP